MTTIIPSTAPILVTPADRIDGLRHAMSTMLWNDDGITRFELDVLVQLLAIDDILVVEA
jgi:hypothetical protein